MVMDEGVLIFTKKRGCLQDIFARLVFAWLGKKAIFDSSLRFQGGYRTQDR